MCSQSPSNLTVNIFNEDVIFLARHLHVTFEYDYIVSLEKEVATHSSILAWRTPWTEAAVHGVSQSQTCLKPLSMHACIGEGNGKPLQCSCLENPTDRGAWWAVVYGVAQSRTRLKRLSSSSSSSSIQYLKFYYSSTCFSQMSCREVTRGKGRGFFLLRGWPCLVQNGDSCEL